MPEAPGSQPLITPRKLITALTGRGKKDGADLSFPGLAVLTTVYPVYKRLKVLLDAVPLTEWAWKHPPFCLFEKDGVPWGVLACCSLGAPQVAILIEELAAFGVHAILFLGFAGGIGEDRQQGDILVPPYAYVGEGTTRYYGAPSVTFADEGFSKTLAGAFQDCGALDCLSAPVWTTDALYRETGEVVRKFAGFKVKGVDMETSAVFGVARALSVKAAAVLWISDLLTPSGWHSYFRDALFKESLTAGLDAVKNFCFHRVRGISGPLKP